MPSGKTLMSKKVIRLLLLLVGIAAAVIGYRQVPGQRIAPAADPVVPVDMQAAQRRDLPIWLEAIGTVQPLSTVNVKVRVDGQLQQVPFVEGQTVKAGDLLAVIDPRPYEALLAQAVAAKAKDEAQLESTRVELDRAEQLAAALAGSKQTADTFRAQFAALKATVQADAAAVDSARLQLSFTRVTAPISGRTGQRLAYAGSIVHASDANGIVTVTQMNPISIVFALPQDNLMDISHQSKSQSLQVVAMTRDGAREIAKGTLVFTDNQVSAATGQVQFKANFDNSEGSLWPGQLVAVRVLLRTQANVVTVPATAVQQGQNGSFVYVVRSDHSVEARNVDAGPVVDGLQWIRKGISEGEMAVTQGQYRIAPGVKVSQIPATGRP